jgi:hypothetical protein
MVLVLILPGVRAAAHRSIAAPCAATDRSIGTRRWAGVNALDIGREKFFGSGKSQDLGIEMNMPLRPAIGAVDLQELPSRIKSPTVTA